MIDADLDRLLVQVRRIEEHREKGAEAEIRKTYQKLLQELRHYMADEYSRYAEDDKLTYDILQRNGYYARFLEEVEQKINDISPEVRRTIRSTVEQTYEHTYNGMINCVQKAAAGVDLGTLKGCAPEVIKRAVENPISKLTLNDRLEKHRKEIIYDIKQDISVGLMNGDRYSTMANRIKKSVEGDYKKAIRIARTETHRVREAGNHDAAVSVNDALKNSTAGIQMMKTWRTMKDERVRPAKARGRNRKYDHRKMEGVSIPIDEEFTLPSGAKTMAPGQSGVAGEDINCRCYLSYGLQKSDIANEEQTEYNDIIENSQASIDRPSSLDECKTVEEVQELMKSKRWFNVQTIAGKEYDSNDGLSLAGCDLQCAKEIYKTHEQLFNKYPQLKGKLNSITTQVLPEKIYAQCSVGFGHGGIAINKKAYGSLVKLKKHYDNDVSIGYHPSGTSWESIVTHELGHAIDDYLTNTLKLAGEMRGKPRYVSSVLRPKVMSKCKLSVSYQDIKLSVSEYAAENPKEWFAECFAEYMDSKNPRVVASEFGKQLDEMMKGVT